MVLAAGLAMSVSVPSLGQQAATPSLPAWQDGASVYLRADRPVEPQTSNHASQASLEVSQSTAPAVVAPAAYEPPEPSPAASANDTPAETDDVRRRLAPPSSHALASPGGEHRSASERLLPSFGLSLDSTYTMLAGLAMVVGLFLVCSWVLRKSVRSSSNVLPGDVVSVLGRVPLAARQFAQLLRVGNKLVLVSVTPSGAETLAEVTDPAEVDRLLGICQQLDPKSTTREFEKVFRQLAGQKTPESLVEPDTSDDQGLYRSYLGGERG